MVFFVKRHLILILGFIGTTFVFWSLSGLWWRPGQLSLMHGWETSTRGLEWISVAHDFDKDGISEIFQASYNPEAQIIHLILKRLDQTVIKQYNIYGKIRINGPDRWFSFGDVTKDGIDDLILFLTRNDSLFITIINYFNDDYEPSIFFLTHCTSCSLYKKEWDLYINDSKIVDLNKDGEPELLFSLFTGFTKSPRGVYLFDFSIQSIRHRFETGLSAIQLDVWDINQDDRLEIILSTYASANLPRDSLYSDIYSWAVVLNDSLSPLFSPFPLHGFTSTFLALGYTDIFENRSLSYLIGAVNTSGKVNEPNLFLKIDHKGHIIKSKILDNTISHFYIKRTKDNSIIILRFKNEPSYILEKYDNLFNVTKVVNLEKRYSFYIDYINNNTKPNIIAYSNFDIKIFDVDLNLIAYFRYPKHITSMTRGFYHLSVVSFNRVEPKGLLFSIPTTNASFLVRYISNPWYSYRLPISIFISGILYLLIRFTLYLAKHRLFHSICRMYMQDITSEALCLLTPSGRLVWVNSKAQSLLEISPTHKTSIWDIKTLQNYPLLQQSIKQAISQGHVASVEIILKNNQYYFEIIPLKKNYLTRYLIRFNPSKKFSSSKEFPLNIKIWINSVRKLAHDMKGSLSNLSIGLQQVKNKLYNDTNLIDLLYKEISFMDNMVNSFLKQLNLENPNFKKAKIQDAVRNAINHFSIYFEDKYIDLKLYIDEKITPFYFDKDLIELALKNLIENAIYAMKGKGVLSIKVRLVEDTFSSISKMCEIIISDTGKGIPEHDYNKIFEPGYTTRPNGTGLGLSIVKKIIEYDHHGKIIVRSSNLGTTFILHIPLIINKDANL